MNSRLDMGAVARDSDPACRRRAYPLVLVAQGATCAVALGVVALMPSASGPVMLVSLTGRPQGAIVDRALAHDARLVGRGYLPGSVVVTGGRSGMLPALLRDGTVAVAASYRACSSAWAGQA